ncbi:E3 ubiquitin-protein ligase MBR1 [Heracleum sosnowskyi]|uniref:RING-type E3 ubiquitin transferase n=1 Tax=Heracleum sosnowskyi TaxID=360622 RepID=A0AAD8MVC1_9APIA|nr:E3 ubiquitin-protein ligase MBR1 [Heracleum sosnowskyi]
MDRFSSKRTVGRLCVPKKTSSLVLRDAADNKNGDAQFCNRLGCSGRLNYAKAAHIGSSSKSKSWRPSTHLTTGKETGGSSSSSSSSVVNNAKIRFPDSRRKLPSKLETVTSESSSTQDEIEELIVAPRTNTRGSQSGEPREAESGKAASVKVGSSTMIPKARNQYTFGKRPGLANQDALASSSSSSSESNGQRVRGSAFASRHGLRNLRTSISDALRPSCSLSESNSSKRDTMKKRNSEGESSYSGEGKKKMSGQPSDSAPISNSTNDFTFPDSRRIRNWPSRENGGTSVRSRRLANINIRSPINGNIVSSAESSVMPQSERNIPVNANSLHEEAFTGDLGIDSLMNSDGSRHYNMDGIAEVLLALERIEQDEELTYEQLLALETNLFIGGLGFYDRHRDMRLDIENMSYEELLALEEKMGNVSTALSEDALLKSVTVSTYQGISTEEEEAASSIKAEDTKCSICQEEYMIGDEVGKIGCEHGYHMGCLKQWLQLKNWCPICKASVDPAETS